MHCLEFVTNSWELRWQFHVRCPPLLRPRQSEPRLRGEVRGLGPSPHSHRVPIGTSISCPVLSSINSWLGDQTKRGNP